jgi:hypothetical protein
MRVHPVRRQTGSPDDLRHAALATEEVHHLGLPPQQLPQQLGIYCRYHISTLLARRL